MRSAGILAKGGMALAIASSCALLRYGLLGPKDGNPIGLGLLMAGGVLVGGTMLALVGLIAVLRGSGRR